MLNRAALGGALLVILLNSSLAAEAKQVPPSGALDKQWEAYWPAGNPRQTRSAGRKLVAAGVGFDTAYAELTKGRLYAAKVKRGLVRSARVGRGGLQHLYAFVVPDDYDPKKSCPVIFYLHGGVSRPAPNRSDSWWPESLVESAIHEIIVIPASWSDSLWWQAYQVENLGDILDRLKRTYNINSNRLAEVEFIW